MKERQERERQMEKRSKKVIREIILFSRKRLD